MHVWSDSIHCRRSACRAELELTLSLLQAVRTEELFFSLIRYFRNFPLKSTGRSNGCNADSIIRAASRRVSGWELLQGAISPPALRSNSAAKAAVSGAGSSETSTCGAYSCNPRLNYPTESVRSGKNHERFSHPNGSPIIRNIPVTAMRCNSSKSGSLGDTS